MGELVIGKYIRLSQADTDLMKKENKTESESISHQRDLIQNYIDANSELKHCRQEEFFDDGYTGKNFERPSFERLISKIKTGEINCIVVKDFSRFGRDYIELGDYMERIFPFLGVRFISVNDHYDSKDYKGTTGGLDVVMKNIVYDFYSKDLSVKVRTAKRSKMKQGKYLNGHVPFGLKTHDTIKGKLAIDAEAAETVRKSFGYALEGMNCSAIARKLNEERLETPGQYYRRKHPGHKNFKNQSRQLAWNATMVRNILTQEMHYGAVVGHKREKVVPCGKATRAVPKDKQIIVEGCHDPIVSKEEWLKAQEVIRPMKSPERAGGRDYPLKGFARCGCCGRKLQYNNDQRRTPLFKCVASLNNPNAECYTKMIPAAPINDAVFEAIQRLMECTDAVEQKVKVANRISADQSVDAVKQIRGLQMELESCEAQKMDNIERLNTGEITKEEYLEERAVLNERVAALKQKLEEMQNRKQEADAAEDPELESFLDAGKKYRQQTEMTNEMVRAFVDTVLIYEPGRIEIKWKFSDKVLGMTK